MSAEAAAGGESIFIEIRMTEAVASDPELAAKLQEVCPVSIFRATDTGTEIVAAQLDECVLCDLCVEAAPAGGIEIVKKYD
jgi:NAD-dependent dihydropyrimidine dehydrogenase PreA subunit